MIKIRDNLWVGNSDDERASVKYVRSGLVDRVLVVAHDMVHTDGWKNRIEYMQVGLIDGPGNLLAAYHAAVLALVVLLKKGKVLVCCHNGGRSLAVAIMYLYLMGDGPSWDEALDRLKTNGELPSVHDAHREAFFLMDWGMLARVINEKKKDK